MNPLRSLRSYLPFLLLLLPLVLLANYQKPKVRQARLDAKLIAAVHSHDINAVLDALAQGANPNVRDYYRPTPTFLIRLRHPDAARIDDAVRAEEWEPVLTSAVMGHWQEAESGPDPKIIEALLAHGAKVNAPDFRANTALGFAAGQGNVALTKELLDRGAAVNQAGMYGYTPLMNTGFPVNVPVARLLLNSGANPNLQSSDGETALMTAATDQSPALVKLLLAHSANPKLQNSYGRTALQQELNRRRLPNPVLVKLLQEAGG